MRMCIGLGPFTYEIINNEVYLYIVGRYTSFEQD